MCDKQEVTEQETENSEPRVYEECDQVTLQESNHADLSVQLENANEEAD